jgi:hypothetical protein
MPRLPSLLSQNYGPMPNLSGGEEIDSNDLYAAEEKERLKQRVRQEFDSIL